MMMRICVVMTRVMTMDIRQIVSRYSDAVRPCLVPVEPAITLESRMCMRPLESPPPAFMVESFTVAAHAAHDGNEIRRALGELEMPDDVVNVRDLRKAMIKHAPVTPHVGDLIVECCRSKFADPILYPVGIPLFSRHFHQKRGRTVQTP